MAVTTEHHHSENAGVAHAGTDAKLRRTRSALSLPAERKNINDGGAAATLSGKGGREPSSSAAARCCCDDDAARTPKGRPPLRPVTGGACGANAQGGKGELT